ncbi:uncharacterized protein LOC133176451 [Saccostrea echinata]|uniref:uncharacterized protein LOC133176451 n=1 Tax=Saccostrea echinata TaxID=191078 RepID=UPI002A83DE5A|nr:uncharacterized protein LOC133176451 [Saccostrea echinata]
MTEGGFVVFCYRQKTGMIFCMFWILIFIGAVKGETACQRAMAQYSLPGASLCYNTSGMGNRVVLDVFDAQYSSVTNCRCTVTTTNSTKVSFLPLSGLQPAQYCSSTILVQTSTGSGVSINCFILGSLNISPSVTMSISFEKPRYNFDAGYCMLLTADNTSAMLTLKCEGDIPGSIVTTSTTPSTTTTTTPITTTSATTQRITTTTTARPTQILTSTPTPPTTTSTSTTTTPLPTSTTKSSTTSSQPVSTQITTTKKQSTTERITQSTTKRPSVPGVTTKTTDEIGQSAGSTSEWSYIIPLVGAGLIVIAAIILAICYSQRRKRKNMYAHRNSLSAYENVKSPYSSDFDAGPGMTSKISTSTNSTYINAIVNDDVRDDVSVSTNLSEGTYIRHSVRQPINNDALMYSVVDKSTKENKPATDAIYSRSQEDKPASQTQQPTATDAMYSQVDKTASLTHQPTEADVVY